MYIHIIYMHIYIYIHIVHRAYIYIVKCQEIEYGILNYLHLEYRFDVQKVIHLALQLAYATRKSTDRIYFYIGFENHIKHNQAHVIAD